MLYDWKAEFHMRRHDIRFHLGLGDVRVTQSDQDDICEQIATLAARLAEAEALLRPLADIPIEDFGKERKPDCPLMGWNNHTLYARDVLAARAFLAGASE